MDGIPAIATNMHEDHGSGVFPLGRDNKGFQWICHRFSLNLLVYFTRRVTSNYKD